MRRQYESWLRTGFYFRARLDFRLNALNEDGCDRIFCDKGESGAKNSRPEWDNCLDHLRKGDKLVIWKLDRASRSTKHLIELAEDLEKRGIERLAEAGELSITDICAKVGISRASYYRLIAYSHLA